jgi:hypothetical protein
MKSEIFDQKAEQGDDEMTPRARMNTQRGKREKGKTENV